MGIPLTPPNGQILPTVGVLPGSSQMNFGQMIGQVSAWNPNALPQIPGFINNIVRDIYDKKQWYGLYTSGEIITPSAYSTGTATVTLGSTTVTGNGTTWDTYLIGRQFRQGLTCPPYTITGVDPFAQTLTLALPFGAPFPPNQTTMTGGYFIVQMYYNLGSNLKFVSHCACMFAPCLMSAFQGVPQSNLCPAAPLTAWIIKSKLRHKPLSCL